MNVIIKRVHCTLHGIEIVEFANSVNPDEVAHSEPPYLVLQCLHSCLNSQYDKVWTKHSLKFRRCKTSCLL